MHPNFIPTHARARSRVQVLALAARRVLHHHLLPEPVRQPEARVHLQHAVGQRRARVARVLAADLGIRIKGGGGNGGSGLKRKNKY